MTDSTSARRIRVAALGARALLCLLAPALLAGQAAAADPGRERLFARLTTQQSEVFLQQVFDVTVSVYSRHLTLGREIALVDLEAAGLSFSPFRDLGSASEAVDGSAYTVRRFLGQAQAVAVGKSVLQPSVRTSIVVPGARQGAGSRGSAQIQEVVLRPAPLQVLVRPLPEAGRPAGFTGAVGTFSFTTASRPAAVAEGSPVTLTMEISGRGNIESLAAPRVPAGDGFRSYEPKLVRKELRDDRTGGRLVFEQVLVPRSTAVRSLPAVSFSYFDPGARSYREIVGKPLPLSVSPSPQAGPVVVEAPALEPGAAGLIVGADVVPLKPPPEVWTDIPARPWYASGWFLALQALPLAILAGLAVAVRRRDRRARDVAKTRRELAPSAAAKGLEAAAKALQQGDVSRYHDGLWEALTTYFGNRLNLLPGEISGDVVAARLAEAGLAPASLARLGEIFRLCEQGRFGGPGAAAAPGDEQRARLAEVLGELRRILQAVEEVTR
jgi:hypothetical protein